MVWFTLWICRLCQTGCFRRKLPNFSIPVVRKTEKTCNQKRTLWRRVRRKAADHRVVNQRVAPLSAGFPLRSNGLRLRVAGCGLRVTGYRLQVASCGSLNTDHCLLLTAYCLLLTAYWSLWSLAIRKRWEHQSMQGLKIFYSTGFRFLFTAFWFTSSLPIHHLKKSPNYPILTRFSILRPMPFWAPSF